MRYLKDVLQMEFPQIRARAAAAEAEALARQVIQLPLSYHHSHMYVMHNGQWALPRQNALWLGKG